MSSTSSASSDLDPPPVSASLPGVVTSFSSWPGSPFAGPLSTSSGSEPPPLSPSLVSTDAPSLSSWPAPFSAEVVACSIETSTLHFLFSPK